MSTRSGKRIHGSFLETTNNTENELILKGEKKTRSKRLKENSDDTAMKAKKRNNYVSYPTSEPFYDNTIAAEKNTGETLRVDHKVIIKERNLNVSLNIGEVSLDSKTVTRQTRRAKRSAENHTEDSVVNGIIEKLPKNKNKSKKGKKKKAKSAPTVSNDTKEEQAEIPKKSKKKKVKTVLNISPNKSNGSVDSFHSAAESPEPLQKVDTPKETLRKTPLESSKRSKPDDSTDCDSLNATNPKRSKKSKLSNHSDNISIEETSQSRESKCSYDSENNNDVNNESNRVDQEILDITFEKESRPKRKSSLKNNTFDKPGTPINKLNSTYEKKNTPDKLNVTLEQLDITFEKEPRPKRKSSLKNNTFDKPGTPINKLNSTYEKTNTPDKLNVTYDRDNELKKSIGQSTVEKPVCLNSTFDKSNKSGQPIINSTFDEDTRLNLTFENTESERKSDSKSLNSDRTVNLIFNKSNNCSKISITSDDSHIDNIVNTTPVLIESSMDESREPDSSPIPDKKTEISDDKLNVSLAPQTPNKNVVVVLTPLKREGTFTKEGPEIMIMSPRPKLSSERTPVKRMSLPSAGYTPFHVSRSSNKEKSVLNLTHSIEKAGRRSSLAEPAPRMTRVMFCSPVNNPAVVMQQKRKVIKSNLKGSNKSFVFNESATETGRPAPRKRSYTHNDADAARVKRSRLADGLQTSVDRLSRPRTASATVKLPEPSTPSKKPLPAKTPTPSKASSEVRARTKLPNFAALHQKQFDRMESLDECQKRRAKRARHLRTPNGSVTVLDRSSPTVRVSTASPAKPAKKTDTLTKTPKAAPAPQPPIAKVPNLPTLESLRPGFTRFGFRMHTDTNPFSIPATAAKPREIKPNGLVKRQHTLPSLNGTTSRKEAAKQTVMREKSFTSLSGRRNVKRTEARTTIKGVRTNRRFELQMMLRNINA